MNKSVFAKRLINDMCLPPRREDPVAAAIPWALDMARVTWTVELPPTLGTPYLVRLGLAP